MQTLENITDWIDNLKAHNNDDISKYVQILVGTKKDIESDRQVKYEDSYFLAVRNNQSANAPVKAWQTFHYDEFVQWIYIEGLGLREDSNWSSQVGVPINFNRFIDNSDGTVTDKLTGLMWFKDADCGDSITPAEVNSHSKADNKKHSN